MIRDNPQGCFLGYVSQTDPKGKLPSWLVNKITQKFAPKVVKQLRKAADGYETWKAAQNDPFLKPWVYPEQTMNSPRISVSDVSIVYKNLDLNNFTSNIFTTKPNLLALTYFSLFLIVLTSSIYYTKINKFNFFC